jgi:hypothetical protein
MRGSTLRALLADNYNGRGGFLSLSGLHVKVRCEAGHPVIDAAIDDAREYRVITTDFLADGGDSFGRIVLHAPGTRIEKLWDRPVFHDVAADLIQRRQTVRVRDLFDRAHPRVEMPGPRPVCKK